MSHDILTQITTWPQLIAAAELLSQKIHETIQLDPTERPEELLARQVGSWGRLIEHSSEIEGESDSDELQTLLERLFSLNREIEVQLNAEKEALSREIKARLKTRSALAAYEPIEYNP